MINISSMNSMNSTLLFKSYPLLFTNNLTETFQVEFIHCCQILTNECYLTTNTSTSSLIFVIVGVILLKTYSGNNKMLLLLSSFPQLLLIYTILILVRAIMIFCIHFILKHIAYGFTWQDSIVTIWSGLRGSVSLVLALTLFNSKIKDKYKAEIILIHTIAIVFLTCTG